MNINTLDKELNTRDRWMGNRHLKQENQPTPYARRTTEGEHITQKQRAQKAADYLGEEQWGQKRKNTEVRQTINKNYI